MGYKTKPTSERLADFREVTILVRDNSLNNHVTYTSGLLSLFCTILLLLILYDLIKICKAVRQREPEAIDQHDPEELK